MNIMLRNQEEEGSIMELIDAFIYAIEIMLMKELIIQNASKYELNSRNVIIYGKKI